MNATELYNELTTGPLAAQIASHIASGDDGAIYSIMHTKDIPSVQSINANEFAIWTVTTGQRAVIEDTASTTNDPLRSVALALQDLLRGNLNQMLDLSNPSIIALTQAWRDGGKMTQADYDSLLAIGTKLISRAEQLNDSITIQQIATALRG